MLLVMSAFDSLLNSSDWAAVTKAWDKLRECRIGACYLSRADRERIPKYFGDVGPEVIFIWLLFLSLRALLIAWETTYTLTGYECIFDLSDGMKDFFNWCWFFFNF